MRHKADSRFLFGLLCVSALLLAGLEVSAQVATGGLRGTVTDPSKAAVPGAAVVVRNRDTGAERTTNTNSEGEFQVPTLIPGPYEVRITAQGFKTSRLDVTISVGGTVTADISLEVGGAADTVTVSADTATTINPTDFKVDGVITRRKVDTLPLNGRNFLQLAVLEPGVKVSTSTVGDANNLFNVSIGGGNSALTRITVDGGSVVDYVTGGAGQNFSVETVQEFQISSFNFDLATGVTSVGAINIVSRTGTNEYHGKGFGYYRDNHMAAYPVLQRDPKNPDPFFRRLQAGFDIGGPVIKDKLVWFFNLERLNQSASTSIVHTGFSGLRQFDQVFNSPYKGWLSNLRMDYKLSNRHNAFVRFSGDNNRAFAQVDGNSLPSNWRVNENRTFQGQFGMTSSFRANLINDLRFNWHYVGNRSLIPTTGDCPNCLGLGGAQIRINGSNFIIGNSIDAPQTRALHRYETFDNLNWVIGPHTLQTGGSWEKDFGIGKWDYLDPALLVTHDPRDVIAVNQTIDALPGLLGAVDPQLGALFGQVGPLLKIPLPAAFTTPGAKITSNDILQLPVAVAFVGLGDGSQPPPFKADDARRSQRFRFYGQDTWQVGKGLTFKYGLSYMYETNLFNHDLPKSKLFQSLTGTAQANPHDTNNFAPALGFAWNVRNDNKTVVRGGFSMAYDTSLFVNRLTERALLGPLGNGRVQLTGDFYRNTIAFPQLPAQFTGALPTVIGGLTQFRDSLPANDPLRGQVTALINFIPGLTLINPAPGATLNFQVIPTKLTAANALTIIGQQNAALLSLFQTLGGAGVQGVDFFKLVSGNGSIIDPFGQSPYSMTYSLGVQRELPWGLLGSADFVLRRSLHTFFQQDRAHFNAAAGPAIRPCADAAEAINPAVRCLNGPFEILETSGREQYKALLVKLNKRFAKRYEFLASYALSSLTGFNYGANALNRFGNPGPLGSDTRHLFNFSGSVQLPWDILVSLNAHYESRPPLSFTLPGSANSDLNGDGTNNDLLPGTTYNQGNRGISEGDLRKIVDAYNQNFAGKAAPRGGSFPAIVLPTKYSFGDIFQTHDIRVVKTFRFGEKASFDLIGEVFNLFNISNLGCFNGRLDEKDSGATSFGIPTCKQGQAFGIGGPRAFEFAGRIRF